MAQDSGSTAEASTGTSDSTFESAVEAFEECKCEDGGDFEGKELMRAGGFWNEDVRKLMQERRRKGLCLNCGGSGHFRSDCDKPENLEGLDENKSESRTQIQAVFTVSEEETPKTNWVIDILPDEAPEKGRK